MGRVQGLNSQPGSNRQQIDFNEQHRKDAQLHQTNNTAEVERQEPPVSSLTPIQRPAAGAQQPAVAAGLASTKCCTTAAQSAPRPINTDLSSSTTKESCAIRRHPKYKNV